MSINLLHSSNSCRKQWCFAFLCILMANYVVFGSSFGVALCHSTPGGLLHVCVIDEILSEVQLFFLPDDPARPLSNEPTGRQERSNANKLLK